MKVSVTLNLLGALPFPVFEEEMAFQLSDGALLDEVVSRVDQVNPGFQAAMVTAEGRFVRQFAVLINGLNAEFSGGLAAPLSDGDEINVIPAIAGG